MAFARRILLRRWVPYVVLAGCLTLTAVLTLYVLRTTREADALRFETVSEEIRHLIQIRIDTYIELLRAGAALFAASNDVTTAEFVAFSTGLQVGERYPGIQGVGLALHYPREAYVAGGARALEQQGVRVWPPGERATYTAIVALEPADRRNQAALGYDMFTDPTRRAAMERARDTGAPAASGVVTLVQEIEGPRQPGFLIYMPVYRTGPAPATVEERRRELHAFVYSPFRGGDLLRGIVGGQYNVGYRVYDGRAEDPSRLLFSRPARIEPGPRELLRTTGLVAVAGREWTVAFEAPQQFAGSSPWLAPAVMLAGVLVSLALFGIMRTQLLAWEAAARHAAELRASEETQRETGERLRRLVTLEREARAEAQQADRAKDEFLATLSHELRTPLNAMLGWLSMLRAGKVRDDRRAQALEVIERNARTQARLIEDLLDVSRIVTGKVRLDLQPLHVVPIVQTTVEAMRPSAETKGVMLHADIAAGVPPIMADGNRIQQIVWNLLSNAIKFTPTGGRIDVTLGLDAGAVRLGVRDTGIGIEPAFLPHVFERFRQADSSTTRTHSGVGLGLAIVRHLVELHGGTVEAHSDGPGHGAMFIARFPVAARAAASGTAGHGDAGGRAALAGVHVLVVEDDADSRELLAEALQGAGAAVTGAASADEALRTINGRDIDVMVSDIGMAGTDGYELMRRIRRLPGERGAVPAVAVTAYVRPDDREQALQAGYNAHLPKPVDLNELLRTVSDMMHNAGSKTLH